MKYGRCLSSGIHLYNNRFPFLVLPYVRFPSRINTPGIYDSVRMGDFTTWGFSLFEKSMISL
uniref:Uncharacterized protein n=1 Tax=viral metagenome TaxID=1070528 RepID=A0A6C0ID70_9ZZZZ